MFRCSATDAGWCLLCGLLGASVSACLITVVWHGRLLTQVLIVVNVVLLKPVMQLLYIGPTLGPVVGSYITESHLGWRWTAWITLIGWGVVLPPAYLACPETYAPVLRKRAIKEWRKANHQPVAVEANQSGGWSTFARKYLVKPVLMVAFEPVVSKCLLLEYCRWLCPSSMSWLCISALFTV